MHPTVQVWQDTRPLWGVASLSLNVLLQPLACTAENAAGVETLSPSDKLYVVHVKQQTKEKDRSWSAGGPLLPGLEVALIRYPHSIVELEVSTLHGCLKPTLLLTCWLMCWLQVLHSQSSCW